MFVRVLARQFGTSINFINYFSATGINNINIHIYMYKPSGI